MADPLSLLRQFYVNNRDIKEYDNFIIFGDHGWPKTVHTNYQVYSSDEDKTKKEYYTLECLWNFLKNKHLAHHHYVKQAGRDNIPVVHRPDRKNLLAYLNGEIQTSPSIDKNAPIPSLRLPSSEIYKKLSEHSSSGRVGGELQSSGSSQKSEANQHDAMRPHDPSGKGGIKRPHDPEMEKRFREEFAARLYEPSSKKLTTVIPTESVDRAGESVEGSAAISKFGAEKLAALRAKHMAVKRTTIIDADADVGKTRTGITDTVNKDADMLIAMDSDPSKLIKSKEKIWRTRSSVLQAQSKDFAKTINPLVNILLKLEDPTKRSFGSQQAGGPNEVSSNNVHLSQNHPSHIQGSQSIQQRIAYNRYDQERFVKLDIGLEIDTKKSFVGGVANGLANYNQPAQNPAQVIPGSQKLPDPSNTNLVIGQTTQRDDKHSDSVDGQSRPVQPHTHSRPRPTPNRPHKHKSLVPIIIIPATSTSLINMSNASTILQDLTYSEGNPRNRDNETLIQRKKANGTHAAYKITDNPIKLDADDWNRVVAVFVQGPAWQFKGWPWGGSPVEIFSRIKAFHLKWDESKLDENVAKWNVDVLQLSRNKRHLDKAILLKFWSSLDSFMMRSKSFLKF